MSANDGRATGECMFEDVAFAFAEEWDRRRGEALRRYVERYPEYAEELILLAGELAAGAGEAATVVTPPTDLLQQLRAGARARLAPQPDAEISTLRGRAREHAGMDPRALAAALDITVDVLAMLEERCIIAASIPRRFIGRAAAVLGTSSDAVRRFFAAPPGTGAHGVAYHAPQGHVAPQVQTFAAAVTGSPLMSPAQKARWLDARSDDGDTDEGR